MAVIPRTTLAGFLVAILNLLLSSTNSVAELMSTGQTIVLNDVPYYVPAESLATISVRRFGGLSSAGGLVPVTVTESSTNLQATVRGYGEMDDVWSKGFLEGETNRRSPFLSSFFYCVSSVLVKWSIRDY